MVSSFKGKGSLCVFIKWKWGQDGLDWQDSDKFGGGSGNVWRVWWWKRKSMNGLGTDPDQRRYSNGLKEYQCRCTIQQQMGWKTQFKFVAKIQQTKLPKQ
jgi:hypothetical protein